MKYILLAWCIQVCAMQGFAQKKSYWRERICRQEEFTGKDSIMFCNIFDSLNREYHFRRIILIPRDKNMTVPFFGNTLILRDTIKILRAWLDELPHAMQFSDNVGKYRMKIVAELANTLWRFCFKNKKHDTINDVYEEAMDDHRSFEYEAHSVMKQKLLSYLKNFFAIPPQYFSPKITL